MTSPVARPVAVPVLDPVLASGSLSVDGNPYDLKLDTLAISQLLTGKETVVEAVPHAGAQPAAAAKAGGVTLFRLSPVDAAPRPVSLDMQIQDLPTFLARPEIPTVGGRPAAVALNSDLVSALRNQGRAEVHVGGVTVNLTVATQGGAQPATYPISARAFQGASTTASSTTSGTIASNVSAGQLSSTSGTTFSSPPVFELVFNLQFIQTWELLGYSRGTLLNTLSLGPQEETTIDIFTWNRRKSSIERTSSVESEESLDRSDTVRDTTDVLRQAQADSEFTFHADATVGVNIYDVVKIGTNIGAADKDAFATLSKTSNSFVHEGVTKSANRVKQSRQTKVSESEETGREDRVTRKIRNPNMCHALNLDYFEILANYTVTTEFSPNDSGLCVLIDNPIKMQFDRWALRVYEQALSRFLLDSALAPGFAAAKLLEAAIRRAQHSVLRAIVIHRLGRLRRTR